MTAEELGTVLLWAAVIPTNGFVLLYTLTLNWWQEWIGRALFTSSLGLALFVDLSVARRLLGDYAGREQALLGVFVVVVLGAWLKFGALIAQLVLKHREDARHG